jgi:hypothetical protein
MKKTLYLLAPLGLVLAGCSTYIEPAPTAAVVAPAPVLAAAPVYVAPSLVDSDGDGTPDIHDRYPFDPRFR